jgi:hypothetical protein
MGVKANVKARFKVSVKAVVKPDAAVSARWAPVPEAGCLNVANATRATEAAC